METIYKYALDVVDKQKVSIPKHHRILSLQVQNGVPFLWVLLNPENVEEEITIQTFGTGHDCTGRGEYIGTYQLPSLVFHVFKQTQQLNVH